MTTPPVRVRTVRRGVQNRLGSPYVGDGGPAAARCAGEARHRQARLVANPRTARLCPGGRDPLLPQSGHRRPGHTAERRLGRELPLRPGEHRSPGDPRAAAAPHDPRGPGRRRAGPGRCRDAGRHPQPARRSRHPRGQRRCLPAGGDRHLRLRGDLDPRLRLVRLRRCGGGLGGRLLGRRPGPGGRHPGQARPGRCRPQRRLRRGHQRDAAARPGHLRPVPVLGRRVARPAGT